MNVTLSTVHHHSKKEEEGGGGVPAMGCLVAVLEMREAGICKRKRRPLEVGSGRDCMRLRLRGSSVYNVCPLIAAISCRGHSVARWPPGKKKNPKN